MGFSCVSRVHRGDRLPPLGTHGETTKQVKARRRNSSFLTGFDSCCAVVCSQRGQPRSNPAASMAKSTWFTRQATAEDPKSYSGTPSLVHNNLPSGPATKVRSSGWGVWIACSVWRSGNQTLCHDGCFLTPLRGHHHRLRSLPLARRRAAGGQSRHCGKVA